jgi:hypothetical protein
VNVDADDLFFCSCFCLCSAFARLWEATSPVFLPSL